MRISGPSKSTPSERKKTVKSPAGSGEAFSSALEGTGQSESAASTRPSGPVASVDALLALQTSPEGGSDARAQGFARGHGLLDLLEEVRRGIVLGAVPKEKLRQLAELARSQREEFTDPHLGGLLDEIELRAEVELAKLEAQ